MFELLSQIWFLVAVLPVLMLLEGYDRFKAFMDKGNRWHYFPYILLAILIFILIVLLFNGYRW